MTELEAVCCYYASAARAMDALLDKGFSNLTAEEKNSLRAETEFADDAIRRIRELAEPRIPEWLEYEKAK